jgi:hypothetical protein
MGAGEEVTDGSLDPDGIGDSDAWLMLLLVLRAEEGGWDLNTQAERVSEAGLSRLDIQEVNRAANAYFNEVAPLDEQIREVVRTRPQLDRTSEQTIQNIVAIKRARLDGYAANVRAGASTNR